MTKAFAGKICIVTGGCSGIGLAVGEALLKRGAVVYLADLSGHNVERTREKMKAQSNARFAVVDVTRQEEIAGLIRSVAAENGRLDYLFNNAGIGATMPFERVTLAMWEKVININLWGVIYGIDAAFPIMEKQGFGHIVNTSSLAGVIAPPYQAVYCASKYAVTGLGEALRYELAHKGIAVTTICPGNVATPIFGDAAPPEDAILPEEAAEIILAGVEQKKGIIIFPQNMDTFVRRGQMHPEEIEQWMFQEAEIRRKAYADHGNYY